MDSKHGGKTVDLSALQQAPLLAPRLAWMSQKVAQAFGLDTSFESNKEVEQYFVDNSVKIDAFLTKLDTPPRLFFFHQQKVAGQGKKELFASTGEGVKLEGKCVYFVREKPCKTSVANDSDILCGEVNSSILHSMVATLNEVYTPFLRSKDEWGAIKDDRARKSFLETSHKFADAMKRKLSNLRGDVELYSPAALADPIEQKPNAYEVACRDPKLVAAFRGVVEGWCKDVYAYIKSGDGSAGGAAAAPAAAAAHGADTERKVAPAHGAAGASASAAAAPEPGPEVEIEYWSRRLLTLISITEQLKTKNNRVVTGTLKQRANVALPEDSVKAEETAPSEQGKVKQLLEKWHDINLMITDALNEAKDNVRFLENLRKVIEPLYTESPAVIAEAMPAVMNSMKMIHTLSRHYGTEARMTRLFTLITHQSIKRCKEDIGGGLENSQGLWAQEPADVIAKMTHAINLLKRYEKEYKTTKKKLAEMPLGKQFNFDENLIFEKFTRFQRRLEKLIDMFSSIQQFKALEAKHIDGISGPDSLIGDFNKLIHNFRVKQSAHDLLSVHNTIFERDFVEFTMNNSALENQIQEFMATSIQNMSSIDKQLQFMSQFAAVLSREALKEDLDHKYLMIFKAYREDLLKTQAIYERCYQNPPIPRNMPPYAGCIYWSRQLLRHITRPMKKFQLVPRVFHPKESKKTVDLHNTLARTLVTFEAKCLQNWQARAEKDKQGLRSNLVVLDAKTGAYRVQFPAAVHNLMREAKHFQLMGYDLPNSAKIVLLLEEKLKSYFNQLNHALATHSRVATLIQPVTRGLLTPHLADLEAHIAPARTTMTWTSMNIESFLHSLHMALARFEYLVTQVNDIMDNRIEKNLRILGNLPLLNLPAQRTFSLREFAVLQKQHLDACAQALGAKNLEIERAVNDLIDAVQSYPLAQGIPKVRDDQIADIKFHFQHELYHRLLQATKNSLTLLKKRVSSRTSKRFVMEAPLFEVNLNLTGATVEIEPSLTDVQRELNTVARELLQCTVKAFDWGLQMSLESEQITTRARQSFYTRLAADKNVALDLLLLTGAVESVKRAATNALNAYAQFKWLWTKDPETEYQEFVDTQNPILEDFIAKLHDFVAVENEIKRIPSVQTLGALSLRTDSLKAQLKHEIERWKHQYSEQLHQEAKGDMENVIETMAELKQRLSIEVKDIATLNFVMEARAELRDVQSEIDMRFQSIIERYNTLESDLAFGPSKDEMDQKSLLKQQWADILARSEQVTVKVNGLQEGFKEDLLKNITIFKNNVKNFRADYESNGPGVEGIQPAEAYHLLARFQSEFETLHHTHEVYRSGEKLFGLPESQYPELVKTKKELSDLDNLYRLYREVLATLDEYNNIAWADVMQNIDTMKETMSAFDRRAKALNKNIKKREACQVLTAKIQDFNAILDPLLIQLSKPAMKEERHWKRVSEITHTEFNLNKFNEMKLRDVLAAKLHLYTDDILEVTESADRQRGIQLKLEKLADKWRNQEFKFSGLKSAGSSKVERPDVLLKGDSVQEVQELSDDSITQINQLKTLPQQHIKHFQADLVLWTNRLSIVSDTLEDWVRVQQLWMALEKVFLGGDIAKQMLNDSRVFASVDKEWTQRLMVKAKETRNVVECCSNEYIRNILPKMKDSLERCQKALDDYLDTKRSRFARFYFVDNDSLLTFLSNSQYLEEIQGCFPKITENNIDNVTHQGSSITHINTGQGEHTEQVAFSRPVIAKGNIEDWLNQFIKEMMRTVKERIRQAAIDSEPLTQPNMEKAMEKFVNTTCAQVALLGLQMVWTRDTQESMYKSKSDKKAITEALNRQRSYLFRLSDSTTQEIANKLERTKLETLITIQLHQVEIIESLHKRFAGKKADPNDFEWLKRLRVYWDPQKDECEVRIANVNETYCYEYLGVNERLVVTALTDRVYISLSQAVKMCYGGSPLGPAGTGKTETVKDLGRALGKLVIVFNCSSMDETAKLAGQFKGLCQSGSWGCFDEFNRIRLEVLSVVAQQVQAIMDARRIEATTMVFPGDAFPMAFDRRCGAFITMNPGYAGRQELPGNLKALFRSVAMMLPERESIIRVKLSSVGFKHFKALATKFHILYQLCEQQLTKQRHYDFGLRNILSVLRTAGLNLRREIRDIAAKAAAEEAKQQPAGGAGAAGAAAPAGDAAANTAAGSGGAAAKPKGGVSEEEKNRLMEERLMARTLRDMNLSKLVFDDVHLFLDLLRDVFRIQNSELGKASYPEVEAAVRRVIEEAQTPNLIYHSGWVEKIMQLYEAQIVRHSVMACGPAGGGKSTAIRVLSEALSIVNDEKARAERALERAKEAKAGADKGKRDTKNEDGGGAHEEELKDSKVGRVTLERLNPKAVHEADLFGRVDPVSKETTPGIFYLLWKKANVLSKNFTWLVCDGPVDAIWIENLNSVMDDSKVLTVGGRVPMTPNVRLFFEIEDLRNASPATVSRAGIIYVSNRDLGFQPVVDAWMNSRRPPEQRAQLQELYARYIVRPNLMEFMRKLITHVMKISETMLVGNLLVLLKGLLQESEDSQKLLPPAVLERLFLYAVCWSLGGLCEHKDRVAFSRELSKSVPRASANSKEPNPAIYPCKPDETLYDYFVDKKKDYVWTKWTVKPYEFDAAKFKFSTCLVPTVDSARAQALIRAVLHTRGENANLPVISHPVLLTGSSGTSKTTTVLQYVQNLLEEGKDQNIVLKKVVFSSATTPDQFYSSVLNDPEIVRRGAKRALGPAPGKQMIMFLDDLSLPELNEWDDQPTLEFGRQLIEDEGFYLLEKGSNALKIIMQGIVYLGAMAHPTAGRNDIPSRLKRHFYAFNMTPPSDASIDNIYGSMLRGHFSAADKLFPLWSSVTRGAVEIWNELKQNMLPTPSKFHYVYNMRDLSRVFQGILFAPLTVLKKPIHLAALWRHECERVFCDKLVTEADKAWYQQRATQVLQKNFEPDLVAAMLRGAVGTHGAASPRPPEHKDGAPAAMPFTSPRSAAYQEYPTYFVNFLRAPTVDEDTGEEIEAEKIYEPVLDIQHLRAVVEKTNVKISKEGESLVLFQDALEHLMRVARIICMPRGSALLVGVGGSGRQSLARLAATVAGQKTFQIRLTRGYRTIDFLNDIKNLYKRVGKNGEKIAWIVTDFEIINEVFLEYINAFLTTGEVPGMFSKDGGERDMWTAELRGVAKKEDPNFRDTPDNLYRYFLDRIRDNLHVVLCFSPTNEKFAERAQRFPGLISGCTIDWFLPWPEQALFEVASKFIASDVGKGWKVVGEADIETKLVRTIASVHNIVTAHCEDYYTQYRRRVYVTPKSYLAFIKQYKELYKSKMKENELGESTRNAGLSKLAEAEDGVKAMSAKLAIQTVELKKAEEETLAMLDTLQKLTAQAEEEQAKAIKIRDQCVQTAALLKKNKDQADKELEAALPFQDAALQAAKDLNKRDLDNIKGLRDPPSLLKRIMDCVLILRSFPLVPVKEAVHKMGKESNKFMADSFHQYARNMMSSPTFSEDLADFVKNERDTINEETMELLEAYSTCPDFTEEAAAFIYNCAKGMLVWVKAMIGYHRASLVVRPLLDDLKKKTSLLDAALKLQHQAEEKANAAAAEVKSLKAQYDAKIAKKAALEEEKKQTLDQKAAAEHLINMLADNKKRWAEDARLYAVKKQCLVGDCALACAFVSYLGPFNHQFRTELLSNHFAKSCRDNGLPVSTDLDLTMMLISKETIATWNNQGLPKDNLSLQNGILVTQASRYPLLIDPQGQAMRWLKSAEAARFPQPPTWTPTVSITHPRLRDYLGHCMELGLTMLIDGVVKDLDPMLDPVLEKNFVQRGRSWRVILGENQEAPIDKVNFKLILCTKLANPLFSPELCAKTTIVDFSVTEVGLADQLLSAVIEKEKKDLEEKAREISEDVSRNMNEMAALDRLLLERLSASKGSMLEDQQLIQVLTSTKQKHNETQTMLTKLKSNEQTIDSQRNQYRAVAVRGSALFFVVVSLSQINPMYQTSLTQFGSWFEGSLLGTPKTGEPTPSERVAALCNTLTWDVYTNINRGLFESDKLIFKLMMAVKVMQTMDAKTSQQALNVTQAQLAALAAQAAQGGAAAVAAKQQLQQKVATQFSGLPPGIGGNDPLLTQDMVNLFMRGGAALNTETLPKAPKWLDPLFAGPAWAHICQLSISLDFFRDLRASVVANEAEWREWFSGPTPETEPCPRIEERLNKHACGPFLRLLVVRCFREDRMRLAALRFIQTVLDHKYTAPLPARLEDMLAPNVSNSRTPIIVMLAAGSNPTSELQQMAQRGVKVGQQQQASKGLQTVSMGDRQDEAARMCVEQCMAEGGWALLQNCHLGLGFMAGLDEFIRKKHEEKGAVQESFRLWLTCEPHKDFPVSLLQLSVKMTMEPPRGMQAGMIRSYNSVFVDPDRLKIPRPEWKDLVYVVAFLHSVVIERKKYGPAGWCIPYEFSQDDMLASLNFLERFLQRTVEGSAPSYTTIQYMIGDVQYGGRITDPFDEELFRTYGKRWLTPDAVNDSKSKPPFVLVTANKVQYSVPTACTTLEDYLKQIKAKIPENDTPEIFGLHPNVDIQFGISETNYVLNTISDTMPKSSFVGGKGGKAQTREQKIKEIAAALLQDMKDLTLASFKDDEIRELIRRRPDQQKPAGGGGGKKNAGPEKTETEWVLGENECKRLQKEGKWPPDSSSIPLNIFLYNEITALNSVTNNVRNTLQSIILAISGEIITTPALMTAMNSVFDAKPPRQWYVSAGGEEFAWSNPSLGAWFKGLKDREAQLVSWLTKKRPASFWLAGFVRPTGFMTAMAQEVCRRRNLPLDNLVRAGRVVNAITNNEDGSPIDGCYLTGLSLEGCTWDSDNMRLKDYVDKKIYTPIPLLSVQPMTNESANELFKPAEAFYRCPIYTKPRRTAANCVFDVKLPFDPSTKQAHWILRGVALLCSTE